MGKNILLSVDALHYAPEATEIARAIVEAADEHDARMIVLGSAHSTDLPHIPFGSVSLKVLHLARRPVIVVPRQAIQVPEQHVVRIGGFAAAPVTP